MNEGAPRVTGATAPTAASAVVALVRACHPAPTVVVTAAVTVLAAAAGRSGAGCALVLVTVLVGQLSVGWSNDALDAGRDAAVGRADKPTVNGAISSRTLMRTAWAALLVAVLLSFVAAGLAGGLCHVVFLASAWAYNLGLKSTVFSLVPYAVGFGALPGFVTWGLDPAAAPGWRLTVAAALLGVAAGLANAASDVADDAATGVRGAVGRMGASAARVLCVAALVAATYVLVLWSGVIDPPWGALAVVGAPVLGFAGLLWRGGAHLFGFVLAVALLDVALLALSA